jgi:hypothetical protein
MDEKERYFWLMAGMALLILGMVIQREGTRWWLRWMMRRREERLRNTPSAMRQEIADLRALLAQNKEDLEALRLVRDDCEAMKLEKAEMASDLVRQRKVIEDQRIELKRLIDRNTMLANEVRSDPENKTLAIDRKYYQGRWVIKPIDE